MANNDLTNNQVGNVRLSMTTAQRNALSEVDRAKFATVATLKTALAGDYTAEVLNLLSKNDMRYALRKKLSLP